MTVGAELLVPLQSDSHDAAARYDILGAPPKAVFDDIVTVAAAVPLRRPMYPSAVARAMGSC
jgi:hypothetical protein